MKTLQLFLIVPLLYCSHSYGQLTSIDKNKVMDYFQNQQFDEAINYVLPALTVDTLNIALLGYAGYANFMNDNTADAEKYYLKILGIDSNYISAIQYVAVINKNQNTAKAIQYTRRLITLQPGKAIHYRSMGELFKRMNRTDSAYIYYSQAYQLSPADNKNAIGFAEVLIDEQKYTMADSIIRLGLLKDSLNIPLLKLCIRSAYATDTYQNALLPGEKLIRLNEPSLTPMTQLFLSYYNLKLYTDCIRVCDYLILNSYLTENVLYYQAKCWAKLKDYNKSNGLLKTCVRLAISKEAEMYYYNIALNWDALKQYKKAINNYDTAYYLFKNPVMNYNSGRISEVNLKNLPLAKKYYAEYLLKANPTEADEKIAYQYLKSRWGKKRTISPVKK
ncbi:MAG: hypothetical protein H7334_04840 [Ferruginibacter sp.]|nr:hypothetical protein [Ferruginibacter sp.]